MLYFDLSGVLKKPSNKVICTHLSLSLLIQVKRSQIQSEEDSFERG